jgi:hypothetical protein
MEVDVARAYGGYSRYVGAHLATEEQDKVGPRDDLEEDLGERCYLYTHMQPTTYGYPDGRLHGWIFRYIRCRTCWITNDLPCRPWTLYDFPTSKINGGYASFMIGCGGPGSTGRLVLSWPSGSI